MGLINKPVDLGNIVRSCTTDDLSIMHHLLSAATVLAERAGADPVQIEQIRSIADRVKR